MAPPNAIAHKEIYVSNQLPPCSDEDAARNKCTQPLKPGSVPLSDPTKNFQVMGAQRILIETRDGRYVAVFQPDVTEPRKSHQSNPSPDHLGQLKKVLSQPIDEDKFAQTIVPKFKKRMKRLRDQAIKEKWDEKKISRELVSQTTEWLADALGQEGSSYAPEQVSRAMAGHRKQGYRISLGRPETDENGKTSRPAYLHLYHAGYDETCTNAQNVASTHHYRQSVSRDILPHEALSVIELGERELNLACLPHPGKARMGMKLPHYLAQGLGAERIVKIIAEITGMSEKQVRAGDELVMKHESPYFESQERALATAKGLNEFVNLYLTTKRRIDADAKTRAAAAKAAAESMANMKYLPHLMVGMLYLQMRMMGLSKPVDKILDAAIGTLYKYTPPKYIIEYVMRPFSTYAAIDKISIARLTNNALMGEYRPTVDIQTPLLAVQIEDRIFQPVGDRSVVVTAPAGWGKQRLMEELARRNIHNGRVMFFQTSPDAMMAGTRFRGDLEERIEDIRKELKQASSRGETLVLVMDEFAEAAVAGKGMEDTRTVIERFKGELATGELVIVGFTTDIEYRKVLWVAGELEDSDLTPREFDLFKKSGARKNAELAALLNRFLHIKADHRTPEIIQTILADEMVRQSEIYHSTIEFSEGALRLLAEQAWATHGSDGYTMRNALRPFTLLVQQRLKAAGLTSKGAESTGPSRYPRMTGMYRQARRFGSSWKPLWYVNWSNNRELKAKGVKINIKEADVIELLVNRFPRKAARLQSKGLISDNVKIPHAKPVASPDTDSPSPASAEDAQRSKAPITPDKTAAKPSAPTPSSSAPSGREQVSVDIISGEAQKIAHEISPEGKIEFGESAISKATNRLKEMSHGSHGDQLNVMRSLLRQAGERAFAAGHETVEADGLIGFNQVWNEYRGPRNLVSRFFESPGTEAHGFWNGEEEGTRAVFTDRMVDAMRQKEGTGAKLTPEQSAQFFQDYFDKNIKQSGVKVAENFQVMYESLSEAARTKLLTEHISSELVDRFDFPDDDVFKDIRDDFARDVVKEWGTESAKLELHDGVPMIQESYLNEAMEKAFTKMEKGALKHIAEGIRESDRGSRAARKTDGRLDTLLKTLRESFRRAAQHGRKR